MDARHVAAGSPYPAWRRGVGRRSTFTRPIAIALATLAVAIIGLAARAEAYVYWAHEGNTTGTAPGIGRANLDGSGVDLDFITPPDLRTSTCGVAVDDAHIYWSNSGLGSGPSIGRADLDGGDVNPTFIDDAPGAHCGIAVDGAHIYWSDDTGVSAGGVGSIARANLDGTGVDKSFIPLSIGGVFDYPCGVAVDGTHVYWPWIGIGGAGFIGRANLDGTGVDHFFIPFVDTRPCGMAVDGSHVYWAGSGVVHRTHGSVGRANLDGTGVDQDFIPVDIPSCGVAVDGLTPPPPPPPQPQQQPSNEFSLGKVKKNKQAGTAKLTVEVPGSGALQLAKTNGVQAYGQPAYVAGEVTLIVKPRGRALHKLNAHGKAKVNPKVKYTPDGGELNTERMEIKLIKR